jgi:transposase
MNDLIRIGMDTSKSVFVLHGVDAAEQPVLRRKLRRRQVVEFFDKLPAIKVGIEACGGSHYWARELGSLGHHVLLLPPQRVKPYVARNKNDAADAEAICEAMSRPRMRFVPMRTTEQQAALMLVGVRDQLVARRTELSDAIRGYAAEFGLTAATGLDKIAPLLERLATDRTVPALAKELFATLGEDYAQVKLKLRTIEAKLMAWHRQTSVGTKQMVPATKPKDARHDPSLTRKPPFSARRPSPPAEAEACSRRSRWCDRSISRRETLRGTHRRCTTSRLCLDLASRNPSWQRSCATASTDRT